MVIMIGLMKEIGIRIFDMDKVMKDIKMVINMKVNFKTIKLMEKAYIGGEMVRDMMDSGKREVRMVMEYGQVIKEILILENGSKVRLKGMEFINGKMEINMKVSG